MSLLSVSSIQNTASATTNLSLNADGTVTLAVFSGSAAPASTQAGTLWFDTGTATLQVRNAANTGWVAAGGLPVATLAEAAAGTLNTVVLTPETGVPKDASGMTGAAILPSGTTAQRPAAPVAGMARVNTDTNPQLEQYAGGSWQPIGVISSNLTLNVATSGNDTTGLGTAAAPWATPHRAMEYLSNYAIAEGVTVTVSVADGTYTFTTPLNLNHPNGNQIFINGGTTTGVRPTGAALNGGGVAGNTAGTEAFNDGLLQAYYNTVWQFNGCHGLVCSTGGNITVNTVLIRGDASGSWAGVLAGEYDAAGPYASSGGINLGDTVAVHNFGGNGILTNIGGSIYASGATTSNNGNSGIYTSYGGSVNADNATASNNGNAGILTSVGGSINANGATASNNVFYGIVTSFGGSIRANSATASNNGNNGIVTNFGGSIRANSATATGNGSTDVFADRAGIIQVTGATYGTISPALNTVGNLNAATST